MVSDRQTGASCSPEVSIVIVAYESGVTLVECIAALSRQSFTKFEIILVDNGCSDGVARTVSLADPSIRLIEPGENLGFARAVNCAAALARGAHLALINPDAFAHRDWLRHLVEAAAAYPDVRCFASRQLMDDDPNLLDGLGDVMSVTGFPFRGGYRSRDPGDTAVGEVFSACGGAMLIDRALFLELGGFDERLFCYCEDVDLGYRLRLTGERTLIVPQAVVRHVGSASSGGARSDFATFHGTRNRLWVFIKNTPPLLLLLTAPLHLATTFVLFVSHAIHGEFASPWRGLLAGFGGLGVALGARRDAQAVRTATSWEIARAMTWSPLDLFFRRVFIQPLRPHRAAQEPRAR